MNKAIHTPPTTTTTTSQRAAGLAVEWCRLLVRALVDSGVSDVVVSPGSRSTPLVLALTEAAPALRVHLLIDERVASFFALGISRATQRTVALVCTSGTAAAHYFPAVIEASAAALPLLVISADRPPELQHCGASQTIDQTRLFGAHVRAFIDLGPPDAAPASLRALRRAGAQAVLATRWPTPGPVHLNLPARKPLEPTLHPGPAELALADVTAAIAAEPTPRAYAPRSSADDAGLDALATACQAALRGVIVCGPQHLGEAAARPALAALAAATGFPVLAEAASQLRFGWNDRPPAERCDGFEVLLGAPGFRIGAAPDLVIQLGAAPVSGNLAALASAPRWVIARHGWNDPESRATLLLGEVAPTMAALLTRLSGGAAPNGAGTTATSAARALWLERWRRGDALVQRELAATLAAHGWSEAEVVQKAVRALPAGGLLMLGNSLPIREVDTFTTAADAPAAAGVLSQRGAAGIDGLIAGAAGAATATGRPLTLLIGDVSFLHDLGGLAACADVTTPLVIVVLHNDGGRIFEQLPVARLPGVDLTPWTTPHGRALAPAAALFGLAHSLVGDGADLARALAAAHARPGATVIEARVPPSGAAALQHDLGARVAAACAHESWPA